MAERTLTPLQRFSITEVVGRYRATPAQLVQALQGKIAEAQLREVDAFSRKVLLRLKHVPGETYNAAWPSYRFLTAEPPESDDISLEMRRIAGGGQRCLSWRKFVEPYADRISVGDDGFDNCAF